MTTQPHGPITPRAALALMLPLLGALVMSQVLRCDGPQPVPAADQRAPAQDMGAACVPCSEITTINCVPSLCVERGGALCCLETARSP